MIRLSNSLGESEMDAGAGRVRQRLADLPREEASSKPNERNGKWRHSLSASFSQFYSRDTSRNVLIDARRPDPQEEIDRRINIDQLLSTLDPRRQRLGDQRPHPRQHAGFG